MVLNCCQNLINTDYASTNNDKKRVMYLGYHIEDYIAPIIFPYFTARLEYRSRV